MFFRPRSHDLMISEKVEVKIKLNFKIFMQNFHRYRKNLIKVMMPTCCALMKGNL